MLSESDLERFEKKIFYEPNCGCWLFASANSNGYGIFSVKGKSKRAHRVAFEHHKGEIPDGLELDHLCRVRCCVNPDHLEPVSRSLNNKRGILGDRLKNPRAVVNRSKTHCPKGHPFSGKNLYIYPNGDRGCRECFREGNRASYYKRKAKDPEYASRMAKRWRERNSKRAAEIKRLYRQSKRGAACSP